MMRDIGRQGGIEMVRMMDADGRITFSTEGAEIGRSVDRRAEACSACHAEGEPLHRLDLADRSRVFRSGSRRVLGIVTPIYNEGSCATAACHAHPPERKVLGVLDVGVSLQRLDDETAGFRLRTLLSAAIAACLLGLAVWMFARHHLMRPIAALVQATRRVTRDQLELEVPVTWSGELGILATSFNEMTAYATVDTAVAAMKAGAYDYLVKPFDPEELSIMMQKIVSQQLIVRENVVLRQALKQEYRFRDLLSKSPAMQSVFELAKTAARSSSTILVLGESGSGKEVLARAIHAESPRAEGRSSPYPARRSPRACSSRSCSGTRRVRSPARSRGGKGSSRPRPRSCPREARRLRPRLARRARARGSVVRAPAPR